MPKSSSNHSVQDKIQEYFEYLSLYEKDLFLKMSFKSKIDTAQQLEDEPRSQPPQSSLNPYPSYAPYTSLREMEAAVGGCLRCSLGSTRTKFVFGVGSIDARVVFIGEAPGAEEDRLGEPFVGRAGKLLDHMLDQIGWSRRDVYICNILNAQPEDTCGLSQSLYLHPPLRQYSSRTS